jgi:hypothetical protein
MSNNKNYEKYIRANGDVGVLYSPGFGAGWSTWNSGDVAERMVFDNALVEAVLNEDRALAAEIASRFADGEHVCVLGAEDLRVSFLDPDAAFRIEEYDGSERIEELSQIDFYIA